MNNIGRQTSWTFQSISAERLSLFADQVETVVGKKRFYLLLSIIKKFVMF